MAIKVVIFDFDGVIIDSKRLYFRAIRTALLKTGVEFGKEDYDGYLKNGEHQVSPRGIVEFMLTKNGKSVNESSSILADISDYLVKNWKEEARISTEAKKALKDVSKLKIRIYLATTAPRAYVDDVFKTLGLYDPFVEKITGDSGFFDKADALRHIAEKENAENSEVIYIGDTVMDVNIANKIGSKFIAVPNWSEVRLMRAAGATNIAVSPVEIASLIKKLQKNDAMKN